MTDTIQLMKKSVLEMAVRGELVEQRSEDGTAIDLISQLDAQKAKLTNENLIKKSKPLAPIKAEEIPFKLPESWTWVRLGDFCDVRDGTHDTPAYVSSGVPLITSKNLRDGVINFENVKYISFEDSIRINERSQVDDGDILFAMIGTIGNPALVKKDREFSIKNVALIKPNPILPHLSNMHYIFFFLKYIEEIWTSNASGAVQSFVSLKFIRNSLIPLPPLEEQNRIVKKIEEIFLVIDEIAERKEDALQTIQLIRQTTLQQAIQGKLVEQNEQDEPASELIIRIKEERNKLLKKKIISKGRPILPITEEDISFKLPDNWSWIRLGEVVSFKIGKTPRRGQANYWGEGIPWISISDMNSGRISITNEEVTDKAIEEVFKNKISKKGTLIMSFKLTIGKTAIMDIDAVHNEAIISIFPFVDHDNCFRDYLLHVLPLVSNKGDFKSAIKGNTLNSTSITNLMIPLPPLSEQKRIVEKIEQIMEICDQMEELFK